jgi:hypothetical protein
VNSRSDARWFQRFVGNADMAMFLSGRINFHMPSGPNKHPCVGSVLVAYGKDNAEALRRCGLKGLLLSVIKGDTGVEE